MQRRCPEQIIQRILIGFTNALSSPDLLFLSFVLSAISVWRKIWLFDCFCFFLFFTSFPLICHNLHAKCKPLKTRKFHFANSSSPSAAEACTGNYDRRSWYRRQRWVLVMPVSIGNLSVFFNFLHNINKIHEAEITFLLQWQMATFILRSILLDGFLNSLEQIKWEGERHLEKAAVGLESEYFQLSTEQHQMQDPLLQLFVFFC